MNDSAEKAVKENQDTEDFDFDELEAKLEAELEGSLNDAEELKEDKEKIGNPEDLGNTVINVIWDQFILQVGQVAGEDFVKENRGMKLDLSDDAHIQTTENFAEGKIATHNAAIDYQQRYDDYIADFNTDTERVAKTIKGEPLKYSDVRKDPRADERLRYNESTQTYERYDQQSKQWVGKSRFRKQGKTTIWEDYNPRNGKWEKVLAPDARKNFDTRDQSQRGSKTVNRDHVISAAEQIRDTEAAAHVDREKRKEFAKSDVNLQDLDSAANQSKSDLSTEDWLNEKRKTGESQAEYFGVDEDELKKKDKEARKEYEKMKQEGKEESIETGRKSQRDEAFRMGGKALRAAIVGLLAELARNIISKLIAWFRSSQKSIKSFLNQVKEALVTFVRNLKKNLLVAGETIATSILTAIVGPVIDTIRNIWLFLKTGAGSIKEAFDYLRNPENKKKPIGIMMMEIGKIIVAGMTAVGAVALGEVIEEKLTLIPVFSFQIPLFGSLANIMGIFLGAVVCGIAGAFVIHFIDKAISKKLNQIAAANLIDKNNVVLAKQEELVAVKKKKYETKKEKTGEEISERHKQAASLMRESVQNIKNNKIDKSDPNRNDETLKNIGNLLDGVD